MEDDASNRVELLGVDDREHHERLDDPDVPESRSRTPQLAPVLIMVLVAGIGFFGLINSVGEEQPVGSTTDVAVTSTSTPSRSTTPIVGTGATDLLVGSTTGGLVVVSAGDGHVKMIDLTSAPLGLADAGGSRVFVYGSDQAVRIVETTTGVSELYATSIDAFVPSAAPGRVWTGSSDGPPEMIETDAAGTLYDSIPRAKPALGDPRLWADGDGGLYQLSSTAEPRWLGPQHRVLDTTDSSVFAEACDERRCGIVRRSLIDADDEWESIDAAPPSTSNVSVSSDGRWLTTIDDILVALYRTDVGGVRKVFTSSSAVAFSPDSRSLYVIDNETVQIVDLDGNDLIRLPLSALPSPAGNWIAVSPD